MEDYLHSESHCRRKGPIYNLHNFKIKFSRDLNGCIVLGRINNFPRMWGLFLLVNIPRGNLIAVLPQQSQDKHLKKCYYPW